MPLSCFGDPTRTLEVLMNTMGYESKRGLDLGVLLLTSGVNTYMDKILVVDDDLESRNLLFEVLEANGYAPLRWPTAWRRARFCAATPNTVSSSPICRCRKNPAWNSFANCGREIPVQVILMSSFMSSAEKKAAKELGAHALLTNRFSLGNLLQTVAGLAAQNSIGIPT